MMAPTQYHRTRQSAANFAVAWASKYAANLGNGLLRTGKRIGDERFFSLAKTEGRWTILQQCEIKPTEPA